MKEKKRKEKEKTVAERNRRRSVAVRTGACIITGAYTWPHRRTSRGSVRQRPRTATAAAMLFCMDGVAYRCMFHAVPRLPYCCYQRVRATYL